MNWGAALLIALLIGVIPLHGQTFLNGSFEENSIDTCIINLPNDRITALVAHTTAFGDKNEVDVLTMECPYGAAADGAYFLALNTQNSVDAISLELAAPLTAGRDYLLQFFQRSGDDTPAPRGVEIGLSAVPDSFGQLIYRSPNVGRSWEETTFRFTAPLTGAFVTVRASAAASSWVMIDDFTAACPAGEILGNDTIVCRVDELLLGTGDEWDEVRWQDGSTAFTFPVRQPGKYSVEARLNECVVRDSIVIEEYPNQCRCKFYVPTAFSPQGDGTNERFQVAGPCSPVQFEMQIFDRWGNLLYQSSDPSIGWDGSNRGSPAAVGTYVFVVTYRFAQEEESKLLYGSFSLLR